MASRDHTDSGSDLPHDQTTSGHSDNKIFRKPHWYTHVGDFINTLKAFIGISYQALPFSFAQSGLVFGLVGVLVIATLTDHCCQLLVRCKMTVIGRLVAEQAQSGQLSNDALVERKEHLELTLGYGDVGRKVFGEWCYRVIQVAVWFTQFIILIIYFVFIGNTIELLFPLRPVGPQLNYTTHPFLTTSHPNMTTTKIGDDDLAITILTNATTGHWQTETPPPELSTAPDLKLIILFPVVFFFFTSMVRNVRRLAPFSVIATAALVVGAFSVGVVICLEFKVSKDYVLVSHKFSTVPIFLTQLISSYEGIGCILPIHSSMVGARHLLPYYLHATVYIIFFILCFFGALGYVSYGSGVAQMIVSSLQQHSPLAIFVDVTLIISVLFTYPLQCFPVIEITERFVFGAIDKCRRRLRGEAEVDEQRRPPGRFHSRDSSTSEETLGLLNYSTNEQRVPSTETDCFVPLSDWPRYVTRILLTIVVAGLAVGLRDNFAYLASFSGALGASLLAFTMPCLLDLKLRHSEMSRLEMIKDIVILTFAIVCSVLGVYAIIYKIVTAY